jgi:predicted RecB family endonuclease
MTGSEPIPPDLAVNANDLRPVIRELVAVSESLHDMVFDEMATHDSVADFRAWREQNNRLGNLVERLAQDVAELRRVSRYDQDGSGCP